MKTTEEFPIGGSRKNVYEALSRRGFKMSSDSDKLWTRGESLHAHVHGAGSQLAVYENRKLLTDGCMSDSLAFIDSIKEHATGV